jgi:protein phosphatase
MSAAFSYFGLSDKGRVREQNQDSWTVDGRELFIVADGIGGSARGDLASRIVVETLPKMLKETLDGANTGDLKGRIRKTLIDLSKRLRERTRETPELSGMGSTVTLALIKGSLLLTAHMGDSRIYLFRKGELTRLTRDHSIVQMLIDLKEISPEEAANHPARRHVTQWIGMDGEPLPEVNTLKIEPEDRLLLCTDGLTGMLSEPEIARSLSDLHQPEEACAALVHAANEAGGRDNITVLIVNLGA